MNDLDSCIISSWILILTRKFPSRIKKKIKMHYMQMKNTISNKIKVGKVGKW